MEEWTQKTQFLPHGEVGLEEFGSAVGISTDRKALPKECPVERGVGAAARAGGGFRTMVPALPALPAGI